MNAQTPVDITAINGAVIDIPLNRLKASPRNARKSGHAAADIEARAASIAAKGLLQPLVVEPEFDAEGAATGAFLVTIGEGRRLALRLLVQRKRIRKTHPVRCIVDTENDPFEISLDENVSRTDMHPADQFEAFRTLNESKGWSAEEIGARFGVSAQVVRQRLRLGAVSPRLMAVYRDGGLTLDQLMAFAVSEDHARQDQVFEQTTYSRQPHAIRRAMTQDKVAAQDPRARFVGLEAYAEAGGAILRDLFTEDGGGWLEDVALLDALATDKVAGLAEDIRQAEGWKWAEGRLDYPSGHGLGRVYPKPVQRSEAELAAIRELGETYDALVEAWAHVEDLPPDIEARLSDLDAELAAFGDGYAFEPDDLGRGGVFVVVGHDGTPRIERGLIRPEDARPALSEDGHPSADDGEGGGEVERQEDDAGPAPLSDRLIADLTAHRTAAMRDALANHPEVALIAVIHALVLRTFYAGHAATCLDIRMGSAALGRDAEGVEDSAAGRAVEARYGLWARQLPEAPEALWAFVTGLDSDSRLSLLACCGGMSVNAVRGWERRPGAWSHADQLAAALDLDMTGYWSPTVTSYFGRVTKAQILDAVREGVDAAAADRLAGLKKEAMAEEAERLLAGRGWLPAPLRPVAPSTTEEPNAPEPMAPPQAA